MRQRQVVLALVFTFGVVMSGIAGSWWMRAVLLIGWWGAELYRWKRGE